MSHHYFSLISAVILAGALTLALTSSHAGKVSPAPTQGPRLAATVPAVPTAFAVPSERWLVYYIVGSEEQGRHMQGALAADARYRSERALVGVIESVRLILVANARDEVSAGRMFNTLAETAPLSGYNLKVIDLRR